MISGCIIFCTRADSFRASVPAFVWRSISLSLISAQSSRLIVKAALDLLLRAALLKLVQAQARPYLLEA